MRAWQFLIVGLPFLGLFSSCSSDKPPIDTPYREPPILEAGSDVYPAPHAMAPVVESSGGPVMTAPKIVYVMFAGDPMRSELVDYANRFAAATDYWKSATEQYGVGPIASSRVVTISDTLPLRMSDAEVRALVGRTIFRSDGTGINDGGVDGAIDAGTPADGGTQDDGLPPPDDNTLYLVMFPKDVTLERDGITSCKVFGGYHDSFRQNGSDVIYGVVARCSDTPSTKSIDSTTLTATHEIIEAATDPKPLVDPAYFHVDRDHIAWESLGGGEVADLCISFSNASYTPQGFPYLLQRVWSNEHARAGHDPCQPESEGPYFNSAPRLDDTIQWVDGRTTTPTKGVRIPVGQTKTVTFDLFSDAPTSGPWTVTLYDLASTLYGLPAELSFRMKTDRGQNGNTIEAEITAARAPHGAASTFLVVSALGVRRAFWIGAVGN